ncbi:MAG: lytic murein transglycosylase [Thiotrichaceae bacterium]|nr:lytic murein transglycosylase [Thiotrichaceae bacterium]
MTVSLARKIIAFLTAHPVQISAQGITLSALDASTTPDTIKTTLIELENCKNRKYWVGSHNFYVISRYNHSPLYSMAVFQLVTALRQQHNTAAIANLNLLP